MPLSKKDSSVTPSGVIAGISNAEDIFYLLVSCRTSLKKASSGGFESDTGIIADKNKIYLRSPRSQKVS